MTKTYVSLTCLPSRIQNMAPFLDSIMNQSVLPDAVYIHYPKTCLRLGNQPYPVDQLLSIVEKYPIVRLNPSHDYGPITKIYPMTRIPDILPNDEIIVLDDDHVYNPHLFRELIQDFRASGSKHCIGVSGILYPTGKDSPYYASRPGNPTHCLEAAFSYIVKRAFFKDDLNDWVQEQPSWEKIETNRWKNAFLSDDYVLARYFETHGIEKRVLSANPFVHKRTCFLSNYECIESDSLCSLEHNLNKYLKAEIELLMKKLVTKRDPLQGTKRPTLVSA